MANKLVHTIFRHKNNLTHELRINLDKNPFEPEGLLISSVRSDQDGMNCH